MPKHKLLFVVSEDWYFVSHRLPLGKEAANMGYDVAVATRVKHHGEAIKCAGIRVIPFELSRRSGNPFTEIFALYKLYKRETPDIIHHVALKPAIYGTIAASIARSRSVVNAVSGLGWMFTSTRLVLRLLRPILTRIMGIVLNRKNSYTIIQNTSDRLLLAQANVDAQRLRLIAGAGVDTEVFYPSKKSPNLPCVMLAARMLWDKGIKEFVEAAFILNEQKVKARFVLVGGTDQGNPSCIPEKVLLAWDNKAGIEYWGASQNMAETWQQADIACLPSYREGMPKSLLEAAACGLPIVTTDVPGCQEVIIDGQEGFLVEPQNAEALAKSLKHLIENAELRTAMGAKARKRAEEIFCQKLIIADTFDVYQELLDLYK